MPPTSHADAKHTARSTPAFSLADCPAYAWDGHSIYARDNASIEAVLRMQSDHAQMLAALLALDQHWSEDYPGGPDAPSNLHRSTLIVWRAVRAAIARATGGHP